MAVSWNFKLMSSKALGPRCPEVRLWAADRIWSFGKWLWCQSDGDKWPAPLEIQYN